MKKKKVKKPVKKAKKKAPAKSKKIAKKPAVKKAVKTKAGKKAVPQKNEAKKKTSIPKGASLKEVGIVTHYFSKVEAAVIKLTKGELSVGDTIFIKGHTSDFKEKVESMQLEHTPITTAEKGQEIGLKVKSKVREHDVIYKLI